MAKQQNNNLKNGKQSLLTNKAHLLGSEYYVRKIIKHLTRVTTGSGYGPGVIFDDWTQLVQASLEALFWSGHRSAYGPID